MTDPPVPALKSGVHCGSSPPDVVAAYVEGILNGREPDSSSRLSLNDALTDRVATFRAAFPDLDVLCARSWSSTISSRFIS